MFLSHLKKENKESFLTLCVHAALSNGEFAQEEKEMIRAYCREMNIPEYIPDESNSLQTALCDISVRASQAEKNIIILEILGLLQADGMYDEKERDFVNNVIAGIGSEHCDLARLTELLARYTALYEELYEAVMESNESEEDRT